jgi:penicillin-insensitive murein endopeptidase
VRGFAPALCALLAGCVELGVVTDGTSISVGKPNAGRIVDGVRLPDRGEGFFTREVWRVRGQRFGTDELVDLITGVSRRVTPMNDGVRIVIADLSGRGGGAAHTWHRSHQNGRDVDILYYVRDASGKSVEPDAMRVVGADLVAKDGSGITIDVPKTWVLVRELITAPEAPVQWVFMYQPVVEALLAHAEKIGEPAALIERARKACKQPGDSAPHNDHMHVRVYCSAQDRMMGCVDVGPMELLAEREADFAMQQGAIAAAIENRPQVPTFTEAAIAAMPQVEPPAPPPPPVAVVAPSTPSSSPTGDLRSIQRLLRTGAYRVDLWRWR